MPKPVDQETLTILSRSTTAGPRLYLPADLPRETYVRVAKVIEACGGKWNRGLKSHLFDRDADEALDDVILTGMVTDKRQELGQFYTPHALAAEMARSAGIKPGMNVLEPSAGRGSIAIAAVNAGAKVLAFEIDPKNIAVFTSQPQLGLVTIMERDFLEVPPESPLFDAVLMNPPFAKRADIHHVDHALKFLKPGGVLIAIMSAGVRFRQDSLAVGFRATWEPEIVDLPPSTFKEAGTMVNTCMVTIRPG